MPLPPATRLGSYEILALIGSGGMGEVYRAHDPRLGRDVAIKVLRPGVAHDADRLRRFELEARAASSLNHPNILVVHDVGTADGAPFLVSELLDGETLRHRLRSGPIPISIALDFALQIARGLQAAHEKGVVHRDLKPENLFVTRDGRIKILDFGLAKLLSPAVAPGEAATVTNHHTERGMVMGTAGYMAPEQIRGEEADSRADVFAFGAVLYELLTGRRAFVGTSTIDVMSVILQSAAPEVTDTKPNVSPALNRIVRRCLERQPSARFQSLADLAFAIETVASVTSAARSTPILSPHRTSGVAGWIVAGVLAVGMVALYFVYARPSPRPSLLFAASVLPKEGSLFGTFVVSPDGRWLAYTNAEAGKSRLWIRSLDALVVTTTAIEGTDGAATPFWSPDSQSLGFFADNQLKIVGIHGGQPRKLADVNDSRGGAWGRDNVIVFAPDWAGALYQVSTDGPGTTIAATALDSARQQATHRWPHFLPDGRHFVYFARSEDAASTGLYLGTVGQTAGSFLATSSTDGVFAPPGFMLFARGQALLAQGFDLVGFHLTGEPSTLVPHVGLALALNRGSFSASNTGVLVYGSSEDGQPIWFDRAGKALNAIAPPGSDSNLYLSRDGRRLAVERPDALTGANDVYVTDFDRGGIATRFTTNPSSDSHGVWMPDDKGLVWARNRIGAYDLYAKALAGGTEELLLQKPQSIVPTDVSPDGRFLFYESVEQRASKSSLNVLGLTRDKPTIPMLSSGFNEAQARMSPDGRWISYTTDKDGTNEVYLVEAAAVLSAARWSATRPVEVTAGRRVSPNGGTQATWRMDGARQELYYLAADRRLMAVPMTDSGPGLAVPLFETHMVDSGRWTQGYAASPDGQRFLILTRVEDPVATAVQSWTEILKRPR